LRQCGAQLAGSGNLQANVQLHGKDWAGWGQPCNLTGPYRCCKEARHCKSSARNPEVQVVSLRQVKAWKEEKGFGFLVADDGTEVCKAQGNSGYRQYP
jgi:hypothetical protein